MISLENTVSIDKGSGKLLERYISTIVDFTIQEVKPMSLNPKKAVKHSSFHRIELLSSQSCGCYKCLKIFSPDHITEWADHGKTAICPYCQTNSIIGDASKYPINDDFLMIMQKNLVY